MRIEFVGSGSREQIEERVKMVAAACKLSRAKGNVFEIYDSCNDFDKNIKFIKRVIEMGHESTIEHDYLVFAMGDVSPIVEQTLIGYRLTSITVKSRREVDFRNVGYYTPTFRDLDDYIHPDEDELTTKYRSHMDSLFQNYGNLVDQGINVEDARFVLPYSYHSNFFLGGDIREIKKITKDLLYGRYSNIQELNSIGRHFLAILREQIPYIEDELLKPDGDNTDKFIKFRNIMPNSIKILDKPKLLRYPSNTDNIILESIIMGLSQCDEENAREVLRTMDDVARKELIRTVLMSSEQREFEQVNFQFQIPISLAVLTHLTRHRMHSLIVPDFVPMWDLRNYRTPNSINNIDKEGYDELYANNTRVYEEFKNAGVKEEDLIYFYLSGHMSNVLTNMNGRTLEWISRMRACNKAQWEIRDILKSMAADVKEIAPLFGECLGPSCEALGHCPEGKESCKVKKR